MDSLRDRYENLEKRRKNEAEGYQADINLLKQKLRHVEQQLIRSAVTKTKGKLITILKSVTKCVAVDNIRLIYTCGTNLYKEYKLVFY